MFGVIRLVEDKKKKKNERDKEKVKKELISLRI